MGIYHTTCNTSTIAMAMHMYMYMYMYIEYATNEKGFQYKVYKLAGLR